MKTKHFIYFVLSTLLYVSCYKEYETEANNMIIEDIRAGAHPGTIKLSWKVPEDPNFLYTKVSYFDHESQKQIIQLCSRYTDSLIADGLLNKYGKYTFELTPYDINEQKGNTIYVEKECLKKEPWYETVGEEEIFLTDSQLFTNAQEPSEGHVSNIIDDNLDTFFQSFWDEWTYPELIPSGPHYIIFDFNKYVSAFKFQYWNRKRGGSLPQKISIYTSDDGQRWSLLRQLTGLPSDAGSSYTSEVFLLDSPITHMKYEVTAGTDIYQSFFALAEMKIYEIKRELIDPEL